MSQSNGVIRIGSRGVTKFAVEYEDGGKVGEVVVPLDVVKIDAFRSDMDQSFRDDNGVVPKEKQIEHREQWIEFARECVRKYAPDRENAQKAAASMSDAMCLALHKHVTEEVAALKDFFSVASGKEESPPPSSAEVKYSTSD